MAHLKRSTGSNVVLVCKCFVNSFTAQVDTQQMCFLDAGCGIRFDDDFVISYALHPASSRPKEPQFSSPALTIQEITHSLFMGLFIPNKIYD